MFQNMYNPFYLWKMNLRNSWRENQTKYIGLILYFIFVAGVFGILFGFLYYVYLSGEYQGEGSPIHEFHLFHLIGISILLYYGILYTITGLIHPLIMNQNTGEVLLRVPVEQKTLYVSTLIMQMTKGLLIVLVYYLIFLPMLRLGQFSTIHFLLFFLTLLFGYFQIIMLLQFIFFVTKFIRRKIKSVQFMNDTGSILMTIIMLGPLVLGFMLLINNSYPPFGLFIPLSFLPVLNTSVGITGLFLRSGIPDYGYIAILSHILYGTILIAFNYRQAENYDIQGELAETLAKYQYMIQQRKQGFTISAQNYKILSTASPGRFPYLRRMMTLVYKDWLAIRRTERGDKIIFSLPIVIPVVIYIIERGIARSYWFYFGVGMVFITSTIVQIIMNMESDEVLVRGYVKKWELQLSKVISISFIHVIGFLPIIYYNPVVGLLGSLIPAVIVGLLYNTTILKSNFGYAIFGLMYLPLIIHGFGF